MRASARLPIAFARTISWTGATLFALSLAYFLFSYTTTFGDIEADGAFAAAVTWNVVLFTIFAMHHSVFARETIRARVARACTSQLERSFYVWVASVLFITVCALWQPVPGVAWRAGGAPLWILWTLQALGVWLTLRSAAILDVLELAGVRQVEQAQGDVAGGLQASGPQTSVMEFKTRGPYGWVRHPIYTGWFLIVLAASPMTMTRLVFAVVSCVYLVVAISFEERSMRAASAGGYDGYMAKVRWKLLPGLY